MRILVLTPTFLPAVGGAELVILQVYRRLAERHRVLVLTPQLPSELLETTASRDYDDLINFDVRHYVDRITFMKIRAHRLSMGLIPPFSLSAVSAVKQAVRDFKPDIVNVHYVMPTGLAGRYVQQSLKIPVVITYNGRDVPGPGVPVFWKYWHRWIGRSCADMTFVSKYCRNVIFGEKSEEGHIIFNGVDSPVGVDEDKMACLRSRLGIRNSERTLLALQRLAPGKRVDVVIRSMRTVLRKHPEARLIICGKGVDLPRLRRCAREIGIEQNVIFTGFIAPDELPLFYTMADIFVFHSTYETFGIVVAEAMQYGKAVVSVNHTAIPEIVNHGETGLLVPVLDAEAFGQAVVLLLDNEQMRLDMGRRGKGKAARHFSWDSIANQYEQVLQRAAGRDITK